MAKRMREIEKSMAFTIVKRKPKKTQSPSLQCSICYTSSNVTTFDRDNNVMSTLNEWDGPITDDTIFLGPCKQHPLCVRCLGRLALNFDNHSIGSEHAFVRCQPTFADSPCISNLGLPYYYTHFDIKKVLDDEEFQQYNNHAERYQFPGYELIKCPRPLVHEGNMLKCNAGILVPFDEIQTAERGYLIIFCDQNDQCYRRTCYHCRNLVGRRAQYCMHCLTMNESHDPQAFNHYFYKPNKKPRDGQDIMFRNGELTLKLIVEQIKQIVDSDKPLTTCLECLIPIEKTEQCNTLTHCSIEKCYCCGRSGTEHQGLGDHWDTSGMHGCPRFDHSRYWNVMANCDFRCEESYCYNHDIGNCSVQDHQDGIKNMNFERKKCQVYHSIFSLLPQMRENVLKELWKNVKMHPYIPQYKSTDVRTCCPDTLRAYFERHRDELHEDDQAQTFQIFEPVNFEKPPVEPPVEVEVEVVERVPNIEPPVTQREKVRYLFTKLYEKYGPSPHIPA